jgi:hypothetical protein
MRRATRSQRDAPCPPTRRCAALALGAGVLAWVGAAAIGWSAETKLPEVVRTTRRTFAIPFQPPATQPADADAAIERILLQVSKDLGGTWTPAGETAPTAAALTYTAEADGEYWFRLRAVDRKGRMRGGEGPDMRVLVDAAAPRLAARIWKGADGEIFCRYAAADDSIDLKSLQVEYRVGGGEWKQVATEGILVRQAPAHVVGEDIWWAGDKVDALAVRIAVADGAGNRTAKQFTMEAGDPGIDQAALAKEVGVPPLPAAGDGGQTVAVAASHGAGPGPAVAGQSAAGPWPSEPAAWSGDDPGSDARTGHSVLARQTSVERTAAGGGRIPAPAVDAGAPLDAAVAAAAGGMEYRGRPLLLSRSRRFTWDYAPPAEAGGGQRLQAELWSTRDGGTTWQRAAVDADGRSPIDVEMPGPGLYGCRLEMVAADGPAAGPRSGEPPDAWVGIDEEPPHVELLGTVRDGEALVIRWSSSDPVLPPRSTRIVYSPQPEGPWATILRDAENQGEHRWQPDRNVPAKVFVRVEVTDAAGNVGAATSPDAVTVASTRQLGRLGGLRPLPP